MGVRFGHLRAISRHGSHQKAAFLADVIVQSRLIAYVQADQRSPHPYRRDLSGGPQE